MRTDTKKVEEPSRECVVCGSFYPADKTQLLTQIKESLQSAEIFKSEEINALIVPHAGYVFSAGVAATAYKTLEKKYKNIFIIGSSHHINFNGVSVYIQGNYQTPLGVVKVNREIVDNLIANNDSIIYREEAHNKEHTIEVQLPFLQTIYDEEFQIVPIIVATSELETIQALASSLRPYFNDENLFVISTDLSHYPSYEDATIVDMNILNAMQKNSPDTLINAVVQNENSNTHNLQTSACGWSSLLTLLYMTQNKDYKYEILNYKNSGDSHYGEKDKVVGYGAMRVYKNSQGFILNEQEKQELKKIAKSALYEAVLNNKRVNIDTTQLSPKFKEHLGAFVTLNLNSKLKGCIGRFEPNQALYEVIIDMTISASRHDTRFTPLNADELQNTNIEISVLTPRRKVGSLDDIVIGKHGIYIKFGSKNGTYLPKVATDMNWTKEEFFRSCCVDKAGINADDCKNAELYIYEAIVF